MPDQQPELKEQFCNLLKRHPKRDTLETFLRKFARNADQYAEEKVWLLTHSKEIIAIRDIKSLSQAVSLSRDIIEVVAMDGRSHGQTWPDGLPLVKQISEIFRQGDNLLVLGCVLLSSLAGSHIFLFRFKQKHLNEFTDFNLKAYREFTARAAELSTNEETERFAERLLRCRSIRAAIEVYQKALPWLDFLIQPVEIPSALKSSAAFQRVDEAFLERDSEPS